MRKWPDKLRKWFTEVSDLPEDVITGLPRITLIGQSSLSIENHHGVIAFSENELVLAMDSRKLHIAGEGFVLEYIAGTEIELKGLVQKIYYQEEQQAMK
ncbi:sporulation protein YqfC [Sporolactobacillus sp. Y61]|jgi:sporulation protein YqfC|uniref:Sporulation protein YqfC n=1 Tax=Sporolactobacillus sp. Y61 TaxID=3160863 RepID=A0AAU8IE99_9BACL|nr:sporulation protein YqfC [Sporolactobacillus sp. THM19-2]RYL90399.1 sporulation protein YqfC [Sporolactobacillus sp. THM19-2]